MKIIFVLILSTTLSYAQTDVICDENGNPILNIATQLSIPNCLTPENVDEAVDRNDQTKLCGACKEQFQRNSNRSLNTLDVKNRKIQFIDTALKEYKKAITDNLVETLKLRTLRPTGSTFSESISACKMKSIEEISKGCSSEVKKFIKDTGVLTDINKEISNELAQLISTESTFKSSPTLLNRPNAPLCYISEKDLLLISSRSAEEALTPELMNALANIDPDDYREVGHLFLDDTVTELYDEDFTALIGALRSHPLLSKHMESPKDFIEFLKTVPNPRSIENLRATIYSKAAGDEFDTNLAQSCENSFEALNKSLCSNDFNNGKFNLDAFSNHKKIFQKEVPSHTDPLASSEKILSNNEKILRLCDPDFEKNKLGLLKTTESLNANLRSSYKGLSFDEFKSWKFQTEIDSLNRNICENYSSLPSCTQDTFKCKVLRAYDNLKNSGSEESKLAKSSNKEVNELLRSMIGDTTHIEPKTKEILIANGIIPRDDGTLVPQPDIPERSTEYYANENSNQNNGPVRTKVVQNLANNAKTNQVNRSVASSNENYSNVSNNASSNQQSFADFSDILGDSSDELKSIQDEIRRRLSDLPEASQGDRNQTKRVVRESFRKKGRTLSPVQENAITDRIMNASAAPSQSLFADSSDSDSNDAAVSDAESEIERWRNGQRDAALMGMAGAQQVAARNGDRSPASVETPKDLTKIALNLPEDPQIKLSDIFVNKLNANDSETQLLKVMMKNKSNFLLQINALNFRVIFNPNNTFNLLLENGNSTEAERIRPQLEMFLRRLKS